MAAVLAGLLVFPDPFLRSMGLAGVAVVVVVVAAALTLLPALLMLVGDAASRPRQPLATGRRWVRPHRPSGAAPPGPGTRSSRPASMLVLAVPVLELRLAQIDARLLPDRAPRPGSCTTRSRPTIPKLDRPSPIVIVAATTEAAPA